MITLHPEITEFKYRCLFNGYPTVDEVSEFSLYMQDAPMILNPDAIISDGLYGRFFTGECLNNIYCPYGTSRLDYYKHGGHTSLPVVGELRVPYRKIPIYKANNLEEAQMLFEEIIRANPYYKILLRGQNKIYQVERSDFERKFYYGAENIIEPSFLPSYSRKKLNESSLVNCWHNMADILLRRLKRKGHDVPLRLFDLEAFHLYALGIAQHYGLPSVGLDLTDNMQTALWFALHDVDYSPSHPVEAKIIDEKAEAIIFIFRCSPLSVFSYRQLGVKIGYERPNRQSAYFNHCGWGLSKNQLALNLAAAIRIDNSFSNYIPDNFTHYLFPNRKEDVVLDILLDILDQFEGTDFGNLMASVYI